MVDENEKKDKSQENALKSQKQIETAVKFLNNPRVRETPLSQRKAFLVKKGLTDDEIQKAIEISGKEEIAIPQKSAAQVYAHYPVQPPPNSLRLRDFFWVALLGGGVGYLLAHLVKKYLLPFIISETNESDEKIDLLQTSVHELKENLSQTVNSIQGTLETVQKMLQEQQQKVQSLSLNFSTSQACLSQSMTESYSLTEIKSELSSLKGLLLNRRQFPSPVVQSSPFPSIPAWQRNDPQVSSESGSDAITRGKEQNSGILEIPSAQSFSANSIGGSCEKTEDELPDKSISTMSSEIGSSEITDASDVKERLSDSYIKIQT
ncbi:peroxisomal membrane protein PEX14-like isoform X2 [Xenia sp. Carnegie-2017]|uniref:peroxisomal membrane protein PEX14-like isoform X2 n=1 Tax=Xenia sp. Carnegie-2017 TaxID=2897299 RepID=UPI001F03565E|nr:peroxisomal membrane protein PEX14-like isoform X2 [Xenia sp. Carnegie-2017]